MTVIPIPNPEQCPCCGPAPGEQCQLPPAAVNSLAGYTLAGPVTINGSPDGYVRKDVGTWPRPIYPDYDICQSNPPKPSADQLRGCIDAVDQTFMPAKNGQTMVVCQCLYEQTGLATNYDFCGSWNTNIFEQRYLNAGCDVAPLIHDDDYKLYASYELNTGIWTYCNQPLFDLTASVSIQVVGSGASEAYRVTLVSGGPSIRLTVEGPCNLDELTGPNFVAFSRDPGQPPIQARAVVASGSAAGEYHIISNELYQGIGTAPAYQKTADFLTNSYGSVTALINAIVAWLNGRQGTWNWGCSSSLAFISNRCDRVESWTVSGFQIVPLSP